MDARSIDFSTIADQHETLRKDVQRVRSWPFLPPGLPVAGAVYDVRTGRLRSSSPEAGPATAAARRRSADPRSGPDGTGRTLV